MSKSVRALPALLLIVVVVTAAAVSGCSRSSSKVVNATTMDFIPKNTPVYFLIDIDPTGENWTAAKKLFRRFDGHDDARAQLLGAVSDKGMKLSDITAWSGERGGFAITRFMPDGEKAQDFFWLDVDDEGAFKSFLQDRTKTTSTKKYRGVDIVTVRNRNGKKLVYIYEDDVVLFGDMPALRAAARSHKSGNSVRKVSGYEDLEDNVDESSLVTIVIPKPGLRRIVKQSAENGDSGADVWETLTDHQLFAAWRGLVVGVEAEQDGFRLGGAFEFDGDRVAKDDLGTNFEPTLFDKLPASTAAALVGNDFGGVVARIVDAVTEADPALEQQLAQIEAVISVDVEDIEKSLADQFVFALLGTDSGQTEAGVVFEAENKEATGKVVNRIFGAATLLEGNPIEQGKVGKVPVDQIAIDGVTFSSLTGGGYSMIGTGIELFTMALPGNPSLGDENQFTMDVDKANMPDEVSSVMYVSFPNMEKAGQSIPDLADTDEVFDAIAPATSMLGWTKAESDSVAIGAFLPLDDQE